jgi:hypothetical protein
VPDELLRIQIAFQGGQTIGAIVTDKAFDALKAALAASDLIEIETDDGLLLVPPGSVAYVKRYSRETTIGFGGE